MDKKTKLIISAIGLGGLGFFLYKKGLFTNKVKQAEKAIEPQASPIITKPIDIVKKTTVEPQKYPTIEAPTNEAAAANEAAKRKQEEVLLKMGGIFGTTTSRSNMLWL